MPLNVTFDCNYNGVAPIYDSNDSKCLVKLTSFTQNSRRKVSMPPKDCSAVEVRRVKYSVGTRRNPKYILSGINMTVPEGAIYGLLGPSGSGKTTLLKSVVGQITPSEGWIKVFGFQPNTPGSRIPGAAVGYMPQEVALYGDFSIAETLWYFGRLYKVPNKLFQERIEFLLTFLDLPSEKRLVKNLSGGQKRRVSLAAALVHSPPLLILDEPTVGVDPLLRQSIWKHLVTLTQTEKITVIVTTHYIEEASRANIVGLLRRGKLLAENRPEELMRKHESKTLEEVFLKLCVSDTMRRADSQITNASNSPVERPVQTLIQVLGNTNANENDNSNQQPEASVHDDVVHQQTQQVALGTKIHRRLKSVLKFKVSNLSQDGGNNPKKDDNEKRRQSGSHFIQQLMSELKDKTQDQTANGTTQLSNNQTSQPSTDAPNGSLSIKLQTDQNGNITDKGIVDNYQVKKEDQSLLIKMTPIKPDSHSGCYQNSSFEDSEAGYGKLIMTNNIEATSVPKFKELNNNNNSELDLYLHQESSFELSTMSPGIKYDYQKQTLADYCDTIKTIAWKNHIRLRRNIPLLLFQFLLPAIQVILFCICVGNDPFDIPVAIVNEESSASSFASMSSQFLKALNPRLVRQVNYTDLQQAIQSVRDGKNWGVIHIPENFTISLSTRLTQIGDGDHVEDIAIENSTIKVYPDMTSQPIGQAMEVAFRQAYQALSLANLDILGVNLKTYEPPIRMEAAIYGQLHMQNYLQYMSPGVLISISYIMATGLTSLAFITERRDGSYERTLAAGVCQIQMLLSHAIVQLLVMTVQISLVVFFTFVIYRVPNNGPFGWVFLLLLLQGLAGMSFGLTVSSICNEENTAIMMILATFYPNLLLAGVIWPIEAIPYWLRWFSYLQPQTLPTQSLRDLIVRGWSIERSGVWSGFAVTSTWLIVFLTISCIAFKLKK